MADNYYQQDSFETIGKRLFELQMPEFASWNRMYLSESGFDRRRVLSYAQVKYGVGRAADSGALKRYEQDYLYEGLIRTEDPQVLHKYLKKYEDVGLIHILSL